MAGGREVTIASVRASELRWERERVTHIRVRVSEREILFVWEAKSGKKKREKKKTRGQDDRMFVRIGGKGHREKQIRCLRATCWPFSLFLIFSLPLFLHLPALSFLFLSPPLSFSWACVSTLIGNSCVKCQAVPYRYLLRLAISDWSTGFDVLVWCCHIQNSIMKQS